MDAAPLATYPAPRATWGAWDVAGGLAIAILSLLVLQALVVLIAGTEGLDSSIGQQLALSIALVGVAAGFAYAGRDRLPIAAQLGLRRFGWKGLGLALLGLLIYFGVAILFANLIAEPDQEDLARDLGSDQGVAGTIVAGVSIIGVAPLVEELFFRGFVYGGLRQSIPSWAALLLSGLLFGSLHLAAGNIAVGIVLSILGVILAALYEYTGSLGPPILVHMVNNAFAFSTLV